MPEPSPIFFLAIITMSSSILFGIWQLRSVERELAESRNKRVEGRR